MKLFVTGATGFIGSHFVKTAVNAGHEVVALRHGESKPVIEIPDINWVQGSLADAQSFWFSNCNALVHFAAAGVSPQVVNWETAFRVNVLDSLKLIRIANKSAVDRVVVCGSCMEYGLTAESYDFIPADAPLQPIGAYAASKAAASLGLTAYARENRLKLQLLRPFNVFGEGQFQANFWPSLRNAAIAGDDFEMTAGEQVRDFTPVENVAQHFLNALNRDSLIPGKPLVENVGSGEPQALHKFAENWWQQWNAKGKLMIGARPYRDNEVMRYVPDLKLVIYA